MATGFFFEQLVHADNKKNNQNPKHQQGISFDDMTMWLVNFLENIHPKL